MIYLPNCEFYITHTCNLSCRGCHTFNDLAIGGHSSWSESQEVYEKWASIMDIGRISIMGGEPLINPDYLSWLSNLRRLWPRAKLNVYTNGTRFADHPNLYKTIVELNQTYPGTVEIIVSLHDPSHESLALDFIQTNFKNPHTVELEITDAQVHRPALKYCDDNGVVLNLTNNYTFHSNSLIINNDQTARLHQSNPDRAFEICNVKTCHHMQDGRLYKCGPMGILPYVVKRFQINGRQEDLDLLYSYKPATTDWTIEQITEFVEELKQKRSIPQCGLCPEQFEHFATDANRKKTFLLKRL
jgi:organic radical activating enzyme